MAAPRIILADPGVIPKHFCSKPEAIATVPAEGAGTERDNPEDDWNELRKPVGM